MQCIPFRTNNHLEGWHNHLKRLVGMTYPNIYIWSDTERADGNWGVNYTAGSKLEHVLLEEPWKPLAEIERYKNFKECFDANNITLEKYICTMNVCTHYNVFLLNSVCICLFKNRWNTTFWSKVHEPKVGKQTSHSHQKVGRSMEMMPFCSCGYREILQVL